MMMRYLKSKDRWLMLSMMLVISCAALAGTPQDEPAAKRAGWPRELEARGSKFVIYEPQMETFRGDRLTTRAAVSLLREGASEPVFGGIWIDTTLSVDAERKTARPVSVKVTDVRFPNLGADEAARLRQEFADEISRWNLTYSTDALLAELKALEEQKAAADDLKAEVPQILFRSSPAVLLSLQDEPAWREVAGGAYGRLESSPAFVVKNAASGICYLQVPPFWWSAADPAGPWKAAENVPDAVEDLWTREPKPQTPPQEAGQEAPRRPEVIVVDRPTELVVTDGPPRYVPISGTDLLYIQNTDSDIFLDIQSQYTYALFSGRWYRTPQTKVEWEFVPSNMLPADFLRIPLTSEKRHVLACVAGTPQAREAVRSAAIPQTEAVRPGPAPDLSATYDGEPQFTSAGAADVSYAVNTPYSIFCAERRYYWCLDGIWYDSDYAIGPWFVCSWVPRCIYLISPRCPHYYATYCHVFSATPSCIYVGYYPGYRGSYVWGGTVVYGTGWSYRPWYGSCWYSRPLTWGLGVRYSPSSCGWSIRLGWAGTPVILGARLTADSRAPRVQAGVGGYWGGATARAHSTPIVDVRRSPSEPARMNQRPNLYASQPERLAPNPVRPAARAPMVQPEHETPTPRNGVPPSVRQEPARIPAPPARDPEVRRAPIQPREHREATRDDGPETPRTPPEVERETQRTPPPQREAPRVPSQFPNREVPRTPPPQREVPQLPPPVQNRDIPRTPPPPAPRQEQREAPRTPPPPPPPPAPHRDEPRDPPRSQDRRRIAPTSLKSGRELPAVTRKK